MRKLSIYKKESLFFKSKKIKVLLSSLFFSLVILFTVELSLKIMVFSWEPWNLTKDIFMMSKDGINMNNRQEYIDKSYYGFALTQKQSFNKQKPQHTLRIVLIGSSCVFGIDTKALEKLVESKIKSDEIKKVEIINMGFQSCGSDRAIFTALEAIKYEPDIFIVYSGHSEFLSASNPKTFDIPSIRYAPFRFILRSKTVQLLLKTLVYGKNNDDLIKVVFEKSSYHNLVDKEYYYQAYRDNIGKIIDMAKGNNIIPIVGTLAFNRLKFKAGPLEKNCENQDRKRIILDKPNDILIEYAIENHNEGNFRKAKFFWDRYNELNGQQLNASTITNKIVRNVAKEKNAILVDVEKEFDGISEFGYSGDEYLEDHCHFNEKGKNLLMNIFLEALEKSCPRFFN